MTDKKNGVNFIQAEKNNVSTKGWFGLDNKIQLLQVK